MTKFTEGRHPGEFLLSEANFHRSRDKVTIASGTGVFKPGTIVGKITSGGKFAPSPNASTTGIEGAETALAITLYGGDATSEDVEVAVISRDAEVKGFALAYDSSVDNDTKKGTKQTQLKAVGIITR